MTKFDIEWQGLEELAMTISRAHPRAVEQSVKVIKNNTELVKKQAQKNAPYDTGFLHDNIVTYYTGMDGFVHSTASYSGYQEWGTRFMGAQPFMRPAVWFIYPFFQKDMTDVMKGVFV